MRIASRTLKANKMEKESKEMIEKINSSAKSYENAICIIGEYVEIIDEKGLKDEEEYE